MAARGLRGYNPLLGNVREVTIFRNVNLSKGVWWNVLLFWRGG